MSNFGFSHLRLVQPFTQAFREARSAVGARDLLAAAREYKSVADATADCILVVGTTAARHRELHQPLEQLVEGALLIRRKLRSGRVALLFGSEKTGLSNEDMSHCHWLLHIPTQENHGSMNLGQAVAVCLYEFIRRAKTGGRVTKARTATAAETERITAALLEALRASGYLKSDPKTAAEARIRRLVRRLKLQSSDAELGLGMLRQILWKMAQSK
jgi:tRNA/rRNA methyltransferase